MSVYIIWFFNISIFVLVTFILVSKSDFRRTVWILLLFLQKLTDTDI